LANTLRLVDNSIQLNRNLSTLDKGTLGPFTIQATQNSVSGTNNFNLIVSPVTSRTITARTLTETSGSSSVPVGSPFRFGVAFKQGDVPAGASFNAIDGGGNVMSAQADAINHWPDGSVRWCEVRGYTARAIAAGGADTVALTGRTAAFSNTLPGGKTPSQLLTDLQSFTGSQDLTIELSSLASASGVSNIYTTGTWTAHFNTLAAGPYVQQVNRGPCCMGFRAWGQLKNGAGQNHAHVHVAFYVWLWLTPSTGAIRDVEYVVYLHNSLLTQSTDGTPYTSFPPDRYNYNPALKNGATVIVNNSDPTMMLHPGSPGVIGGHHPRSGWFTARADGKPRWITGTVEAANLHISLDPVQANPQTIVTARDYLTATGLLPRYDAAMTDCPIPPAPGTVSYAPMVKGVIEQSFLDWNQPPAGPISLDAGGNGNRIAIITGDQVFNFYVQTPGSAQNNRITALGFMTFPGRFLDVNGRIPNCLNTDVTGLTAHTRQSYLDCTTGTEQAGNAEAVNPTVCGGWVLTANTTHYPNLSYYTYLMEGGAHHRDCVALQSHDSVWWYQDLVYNFDVHGFYTHQGINRAPTYLGTVWYGNRCCSWNMDREEGWAFREVTLPPAILPDNLADGTVFGETLVFKGYLQNSCGFAAAVINNAMPSDQLAGGFQLFYGGYLGELTVPLPGTSGSVDPWMQAYIAQAWARAFLLHGADSTLTANLMTMAAFHRKFHEGFVNTRCSIMASAQTVASKYGAGGGFRPWMQVGDFVNGTEFGGNTNIANFADTTTGWITFAGDSGGGAAWFSVPIAVGATVFFTLDFFSLATNHLPTPFVNETLYRVVLVDLPNKRLKLCLDSDGSNTVVAPSVTGGPSYLCIVQLAPSTGCPPTYTDQSANPPSARAYANTQGHDAQINGTLLAIRTYRQAFGDTAGSAAADATAAERLLDYVGGAWSRTLFANRPMNWIKYP
jgi:hypothetical protein